MEMKKDEVLQNLTIVCNGFVGTLQQHQYLQTALKWLEERLEKAEQSDSVSK